MKKILLGIVIVAGGALLLIDHLANITGIETDKMQNNALQQLIATGSKSEPTKDMPKTSNKPTGIVEQMTDAVTPLVKQVTDTATAPLRDNTIKSNPASKPPIATIKIYDKKTAKETVIDSSALLESEQQKLSSEQQQKAQEKKEKFRNYYKKSEKCLAPATQEIRVQCANEYMRAKAKFEDLYQQGKL